MENPGSYSIGRQLRWLAAVIFIGAGAFLIGRHPPQFHLTSASGSSSIPTIFLTIDTRKFSVPVDRDGSGGGLASHGDELVVLTHEGGLYAIDDDQVRKTEIAAPENGYDAYLKFADDNPQLTFAHYWFRYNDILYIDRPEGGLLVASFTEWSESGLRKQQNAWRPHSALRYRPPVPEANIPVAQKPILHYHSTWTS